ncbi:NAD(P)/FAD-dependent oxidoreductase [Flavobacteriaceae bacterium]|nr:NAD(P)/FAD-dependent oxidoreductase [Flavobacteriaceae bacterium]MDA9342077.1 NAD(P)/FAD-dependent oxidoreductase [Flavobacteriaceae bacterium]MDB9914146.1 NAD(P)/FAD-dependent oxidoreductase [Flavobacteriaceae bacterium]MDB9994236.1 NAD(P)/FAD-dependent oxidoreductase [Flavobacteriaceae bacterium]
MIKEVDVIIVGGGAAGFFTAINLVENNPVLKVIILERSSEVLTKVRISGGGRCNVTHAQFSPKDLSQNYPRGEKELLGPFHTFMTGDTIEWFEKKGVPLKIEEDGRMFPESNTSKTIIDCFLDEAERLHIEVLKQHPVKSIQKKENDWMVATEQNNYKAKKIVIATGSNVKIWKLLTKLGHTTLPPIPSLFTFNIKDSRIKDLPGIATKASVSILYKNHKTNLESEGPLLITHWGLSGPAILKLSAWGAIDLYHLNYHFKIKVNWIPSETMDTILEKLKNLKALNTKQSVLKYAQLEVPKRLWQSLAVSSGIEEAQKWAETTNKQLQELALQLTNSVLQVDGKSTFKEEFVTAGGIDLKEINFKRYESKIHKDLFFAGEVLNIDAVTGGFNFQNAWTGGYIVAKSIAE